jgi:hypothetical protein
MDLPGPLFRLWLYRPLAVVDLHLLPGFDVDASNWEQYNLQAFRRSDEQRRHELKSTMMTSNRPLKDWGKLIEDVPSATAILDRFLHRSELFQLPGRSYRLGSSENI